RLETDSVPRRDTHNLRRTHLRFQVLIGWSLHRAEAASFAATRTGGTAPSVLRVAAPVGLRALSVALQDGMATESVRGSRKRIALVESFIGCLREGCRPNARASPAALRF